MFAHLPNPAIQHHLGNFLGFANHNIVDPKGADDNETTLNDNIPWSNVSASNKNDGVQVIVNNEGKFVIENPTGDAPDIYTNQLNGYTTKEILKNQDVVFPTGTTFIT